MICCGELDNWCNFLISFLGILDTDNRFKMLHDLYFTESDRFVFKFQKIPRNQFSYPISESRCDRLIEILEGYEHEGLIYEY